MDIGDAIVINGMGAYTVGPVSRFNGMDVEDNIIVAEEDKGESLVGEVALNL